MNEPIIENTSGRTAKIVKKYDLNRVVDIEHDNLGPGPLVSDDVISRFDGIDPTARKVFLDWMLYQAGGGPNGWSASKTEWGDDQDNYPYDEVMEQYKKSGSRSTFYEWLMTRPIGSRNFTRIASMYFMEQGVDPDGEPIEGGPISLEAALADWQSKEDECRRQYMFNDEDIFFANEGTRKENFGYFRNWPGRGGLYERIFRAVRNFILNTEKYKKMVAANKVNKEWNDANPDKPQREIKILPPEDEINFDIGTVNWDGFDLTYSGDYKTVDDLERVNRRIAKVGIRSRVMSDVQYSDAEGRASSKEVTIYSDENLDVFVPLTIAASVAKGYHNWCVANQSEIEAAAKDSSSHSYWTNYTKGPEGKAKSVFVYFVIKAPMKKHKTNWGDQPYNRIAAHIQTCNLTDLKPPYKEVQWYDVANRPGEFGYKDLYGYLEEYGGPKVAKSFEKGCAAMAAWGAKFDTSTVVSDFATRHSVLDSDVDTMD